jgi:hypothetical protein
MEQRSENPILLEFIYKFVSNQVEGCLEKELLLSAAGSDKSAEDIIISFFAKRRQTEKPKIADYLHMARTSSHQFENFQRAPLRCRDW